jgi:hypothetical protein
MPREGCPLIAWMIPINHSEILPGDYIQLRVLSAGPFSKEPYYVRIYSDGRVERDTIWTVRGETFGCPLHPADRTFRISSAVAQRLLIRARDGGFCRLCSKYQYPGMIFDAGSTELTLSLHGKSKNVWNHAGSPPLLFDELTEGIWAISPMDNLADPMKFTPQRSAECEAFLEEQESHNGKQKH